MSRISNKVSQQALAAALMMSADMAKMELRVNAWVKKMEREIVKATLEVFVRRGFHMRVLGDGVECRDVAAICTRMFTDEMEIVCMYKNGQNVGTVQFDHGQLWEMVSSTDGRLTHYMTEVRAKLRKLRRENDYVA